MIQLLLVLQFTLIQSGKCHFPKTTHRVHRECIQNISITCSTFSITVCLLSPIEHFVMDTFQWNNENMVSTDWFQIWNSNFKQNFNQPHSTLKCAMVAIKTNVKWRKTTSMFIFPHITRAAIKSLAGFFGSFAAISKI